VPDLAPNAIYLGHPIIFNHNDRTKAYEFILQKFKAKLTTIKANKLNHSGRLVYINSVVASILVMRSGVWLPWGGQRVWWWGLAVVGNGGEVAARVWERERGAKSLRAEG
jgi:hypothetical protein